MKNKKRYKLRLWAKLFLLLCIALVSTYLVLNHTKMGENIVERHTLHQELSILTNNCDRAELLMKNKDILKGYEYQNIINFYKKNCFYTGSLK